MNAITIKNLSDEASRALNARAAEHGRTAEAEAERILLAALVAPTVEAGKGSGRAILNAFKELRKEYPELEDLDVTRDPTLARGASFE